MNNLSLIFAILSMGGLGLFFSLVLMLMNKKFHVEVDPRIAEVEELLPGTNCGSCGFAGCANFAENLIAGNADLTACSVNSQEAMDKIAKIVGVEAKTTEDKVAVIMCQGGISNVQKKADYLGIKSCVAAALTDGGEYACNYGCIGYGDCIEVCPFDAIHMGEDRIPIIDREKCTGCGKCVEVCPRNIIELHPITRHVFVLCKNRDNPKTARKVCKRACIGCKICERAVNGEGFKVIDNLAEVDYEKYTKEPVLPTEKCPTNSIVIVGDE